MGGRGAHSVRREGGGNGGSPISTEDFVSKRETNTQMVDEALNTFKDFYQDFGVEVNNIVLAKMDAKGQDTMAYYEEKWDIVGFNQNYFDKRRIENIYKESVKTGHNVSNGNKTAMEAIMAHELGHALTARAGVKLDPRANSVLDVDIDYVATTIVHKAKRKTTHRGVVQMANKISRYATKSNAEAVAEAVADVYCNGAKAASESKAIVEVLKQYV